VQRCWGKGFATEAAFDALEYAWEKLWLSKVYAEQHPDNRASEKILKKLGFAFMKSLLRANWLDASGLRLQSTIGRARSNDWRAEVL
jgi:RimJ/RimL family protein N-acetyltransferase